MTDNDKNELDKALSSMSDEQIEQIKAWLSQNRKQEEKQEEKPAEKQEEKPKSRMCLCGVHEVQNGEYYCVFCKLKNPFLR